jgi:hypothetical protein
LPLKDEREKESKKPPRSALMMECFDPAAAPEQLVARLEVIGRHATSALYNASEYRRIPMRIIWGPLAKVQEGLGGKARAIMALVAVGLAVLVAAMIFVPYPLKMDSKGQLLPQKRNYIYSPVEGTVMAFRVKPAEDVRANQTLVEMYDRTLEQQILKLEAEAHAAMQDADAARRGQQQAKDEDTRLRLDADYQTKRNTALLKLAELQTLQKRVNAVPGKPGSFLLPSPIDGTVLNSSFEEELKGRNVKPNEPILRVGLKTGTWEIELKIPQKHIGQVLKAFGDSEPKKDLDVDLVLRSTPTRTYKGKLAWRDIGGEATPNRDDNNEAEPVVIAIVRIDDPSIPEGYSLMEDKKALVTGTEVLAKIRCGNRALGYSLFYGVWEFIYEKIVFFF